MDCHSPTRTFTPSSNHQGENHELEHSYESYIDWRLHVVEAEKPPNRAWHTERSETELLHKSVENLVARVYVIHRHIPNLVFIVFCIKVRIMSMDILMNYIRWRLHVVEAGKPSNRATDTRTCGTTDTRWTQTAPLAAYSSAWTDVYVKTWPGCLVCWRPEVRWNSVWWNRGQWQTKTVIILLYTFGLHTYFFCVVETHAQRSWDANSVRVASMRVLVEMADTSTHCIR